MDTHYASALRASETEAWRLDDILPEGAALDFERPFLPEALAGADELTFLSSRERLALNHIRAHGYLSTFGLVEEFILPFVLERLRSRLDAGLDEVRALLAFAGEEAKHIALFRRFREVFQRGFGSRCDVIGPPSAIAEQVLARGELGVGFLILHIEWMTQRHYVEMARDDDAIDARFRALLHQHRVEECQHARIDGWIVESLAAASTDEARARGVEEYLGLVAMLDGALFQQVELDLEALERAVSRPLSETQRAAFREAQHRSQQRTFLAAGLAHPRVRGMVARVHAAALPRIDALASAYT